MISNDIILPVSCTAEPRTCGSCRFFRRGIVTAIIMGLAAILVLGAVTGIFNAGMQ